MQKLIRPYFVGSGRASQAIFEALNIVSIAHPEYKILEATKVARGTALKDAFKKKSGETSVLCIANPHALHTKVLLEAEPLGFDLIICEKPLAVSLAQLEMLSKIKTPVAVCHGYRQTWGIQTLKNKMLEGEFGELLAIEGRYWQSSSAQKALLGKASDLNAWKNNPALSGHYDVFLDLATHWVDAAVFLAGEKPESTKAWLSYKNTEAAHRDTHVHLNMSFASGMRAQTSVSKTVHGAGNTFEICLIGTQKSAKWNFDRADEIEIGEGANRTILARETSKMGSQHAPFHAMGWLEGYVEIIHQALSGGVYPNLADSRVVLKALLSSEIEITKA